LKHYLAILMPGDEGGWRAHFPDFPGCRSEGSTLEGAVMAASAAAIEQVQLLRAQGVSAPRPQRYEELHELNQKWATDRGIDWARAVVTIVSIPFAE